MKENVERDVVRKIENEMRGGIWNKIFFMLFKKKIIRIYRKGMIDCFNYLNKY